MSDKELPHYDTKKDLNRANQRLRKLNQLEQVARTTAPVKKAKRV